MPSNYNPLSLTCGDFYSDRLLGELISSHVTVTNKGGQIKLIRLTESLRELMTITKLLTIFDVYDDEPEAIGSFTGQVLMVPKSKPFLM